MPRWRKGDRDFGRTRAAPQAEEHIAARGPRAWRRALAGRQQASTTTFASSVNRSTFGQAVAFTVTVTPDARSSDTPTGTVRGARNRRPPLSWLGLSIWVLDSYAQHTHLRGRWRRGPSEGDRAHPELRAVSRTAFR